MITINQFVSNEIISALGWTLVNIFWQCIVIAFLLWIFLKIFKNLASNARYIAALSSLLIIVGLSVFNFLRAYQPNNEIDSSGTIKGVNTDLTINELDKLLPDESNPTSAADFFSRITGDIDRYFPLLINIWLFGVALYILKLTIGSFYLQKLRRSNTFIITDWWTTRFGVIEKKIALKRKVKYLESKIVKIPLVIGYIKPVVIVPVGMLTQLPVDQVEAIIAHELAHIRRNDYLVNIFQTIAEIIYFFHPAVWYISGAIRSERENCCDDIALNICGGHLTFARALVSIQELVPAKSYSAVAFAGNNKQLLNRIKRLIMEPKTNSNITDRIIATAVLIAGVVATTVSINLRAEASLAKATDDNKIYAAEITVPVAKKPVVYNTPKIERMIVKDTVKVKHKFEDIEINGNTIITRSKSKLGKEQEMKLKLKDGLIAELYIDGKKIPESEYANYQPEVDKVIAELKKAKEEIKKAMKEVEEIDFEKIRQEVEEAMKDVQIDMEKVHIEVAKALEEAEKVNIEEIMKDVQESLQDIDIDEELFQIQESLSDIEDIDMEEITRQLEETKKQLQEIDIQKIISEIEIDTEKLKVEIDMEAIEKEMQRVQEEIANIDVEKIRIEVEENFKHIDKEKMLDEMEHELQKLEGLELDKK